MDPHLSKAINDLKSMKDTQKNSACWRCCKKYTVRSEHHNESVFRSITANFKSSNLLMCFSTTSSCITSEHSFDTTILKILLNVLLDSKMSSEDKEHTINLLNVHSQMHPACCESLTDTFHNLILQPMEESLTNKATIVEKILDDLESMVLDDENSVLTTRASRNLRKKKTSDDFYTEEHFAPKRRRVVVNEDPTEVVEVIENNPMFRFAALDFIGETISHEFYSKCSSTDDKNILKKTIAGSMFLNFEKSEVQLEVDRIERFIKLFGHCDDSNRQILSRFIELIADTCLFADSGKLTICGDIMCNKQYPLSQLFFQYFIQIVFKRMTLSKVSLTLKNIKPSWLRLNCAVSALRRAGFPKGVPSVLEKLSSELEKCQNGDASSAISDKFQSLIEKRMTEEVSIILLHVIGASSEIYRIKELQKLYDINKEKNIIADANANIGDYEAAVIREYEYCVRFKIFFENIGKFDTNLPKYIKVLQFL